MIEGKKEQTDEEYIIQSIKEFKAMHQKCIYDLKEINHLIPLAKENKNVNRMNVLAIEKKNVLGKIKHLLFELKRCKSIRERLRGDG